MESCMQVKLKAKLFWLNWGEQKRYTSSHFPPFYRWPFYSWPSQLVNQCITHYVMVGLWESLVLPRI